MEADYLVSFLNSEAVNEAIKPFQSRGLLGERHVHKKVLGLPIPLFDPRKADHTALAALGARARKEARRFVKRAALPASVGRRRALVREEISSTLHEIDEVVRKLI